MGSLGGSWKLLISVEQSSNFGRKSVSFSWRLAASGGGQRDRQWLTVRALHRNLITRHRNHRVNIFYGISGMVWKHVPRQKQIVKLWWIGFLVIMLSFFWTKASSSDNRLSADWYWNILIKAESPSIQFFYQEISFRSILWTHLSSLSVNLHIMFLMNLLFVVALVSNTLYCSSTVRVYLCICQQL